MTNKEIAQIFRNVAAAFAIKDDKKYRFQIIAYTNAAEAIDNSTTEIKDLLKNDKLYEIPGIGKTITQRLEELIKTGHVKHFDSVLEGIPEAVFPLLNVPSFGPKKSHKLVKQFNLTNPKTVISDLRKIAEAGKIASLEGFGEKSQADIIRALDEYKQGFGKTTRMALPFASELAEKVIGYIKQSKQVLEAEPLGSLRRKKSTIGDVDIAVSTTDPAAAIEHFVAYPYKERIIEQGPMSASILTSGGQQVDLIALPKESFGSLLQHFTGSKQHNVHLRELAIKKDMSLSERGIKMKMKNGTWKMVNYATEQSFYHAMGMEWIPPEIREDTGEIELALKNKLPKLVELKDMKGDLHIHSNYPIEPSHDLGHNTMQEMLKHAHELGYEYLGFSEHNPSVSKHSHDQLAKLLDQRQKYIEHIKSVTKSVRVFNLLETDILANGKLAINKNDFQYVDAILVSIHSSFSINKVDMTKRVLAGLAHPKAKIFSHPTGRLINERPGYELDFDQIFDFCAKNNKALEINAWPQRLDLPDIMVREAINYGVKLVIDSDSHATEHMDLMKYGVDVARRGWAERKDILNTLSYTEFKKWLES